MKHLKTISGLLIVLSVTLLSGCGPRTGSVAGNVVYESETLHSGMICYRSENGQVASGQIREDGGYEIHGLPPGPAQITVQTFQPPPGMAPPDSAPNSIKIRTLTFQPIPERYREFSTSGLRFDVVAGPQNHDVRLGK